MKLSYVKMHEKNLPFAHDFTLFKLHGTVSYQKVMEQSVNLMEYFDLTKYRNHGVKGVLKGLSDGQLKKFSLAMALSYNPTILLLDEITLGMELETKFQMWKCIQACIVHSHCTIEF